MKDEKEDEEARSLLCKINVNNQLAAAAAANSSGEIPQSVHNEQDTTT